MPTYDNLREATTQGSLDDVKYFIEEKGESLYESILYDAVFSVLPLLPHQEKELEKIVEYLISKDAPLRGHEVLCMAVRRRRVQMIQLLVSKGADVNERDSTGLSALDYVNITTVDSLEKQRVLRKNGARTGVELGSFHNPDE